MPTDSGRVDLPRTVRLVPPGDSKGTTRRSSFLLYESPPWFSAETNFFNRVILYIAYLFHGPTTSACAESEEGWVHGQRTSLCPIDEAESIRGSNLRSISTSQVLCGGQSLDS